MAKTLQDQMREWEYLSRCLAIRKELFPEEFADYWKMPLRTHGQLKRLLPAPSPSLGLLPECLAGIKFIVDNRVPQDEIHCISRVREGGVLVEKVVKIINIGKGKPDGKD